ncbi:RidA family protein [Ekhidna sp.]|jgi:enamine deaminase RidA (YjgF/YER057c/UK114 family)|uniref:RidA family protein n=1 Tax=Ekhidna sp. TaxID=2608089 RepID=UPI0032EC8087
MKNLITILSLSILICSCNSGHDHTHDGSGQEKEVLYDYDVEEKIASMGIELVEPSAPVANYVNAVRTGNLVFMAGKGPNLPEGGYVTGKVGTDLTVEEGYEAAKLVGAAQLSALKAEIGDLNKVVRIVKVLGMVNCTSDFGNQPEVINGFSDTMVEVFGERGKHARAAVGMGSLPRNIAVEIEMIVEVQE